MICCLLSHFLFAFIQFQGDPDLDIKDGPEAWSVTVEKKVHINDSPVRVCSFSCCSSIGNPKRNEIESR